MNIEQIKHLANNCFDGESHSTFMQSIYNEKLTSARIMAEDRVYSLSKRPFEGKVHAFQLGSAIELDKIITNEIINRIDDNRG